MVEIILDESFNDFWNILLPTRCYVTHELIHLAWSFPECGWFWDFVTNFEFQSKNNSHHGTAFEMFEIRSFRSFFSPHSVIEILFSNNFPELVPKLLAQTKNRDIDTIGWILFGKKEFGPNADLSINQNNIRLWDLEFFDSHFKHVFRVHWNHTEPIKLSFLVVF